jgi:peptide/nickel transport system permease protein
MKQTLGRLGRYYAVRALSLLLAVIVAAYFTIIVANMGGELDRLMEDQIRYQVNLEVARNPQYDRLHLHEREAIIEELIQIERRSMGMDEPFFPTRSLKFLCAAMTLQLGRFRPLTSSWANTQLAP